MRLCVVGARGFIGSRLLDALSAVGNVVAVDRNSFLAQGGQATRAVGGNPLAGCSVAYFLADAPEPSRTNQPVVKRNLRTFECFLSCAAGANVRKIILVSSGGAVYGEPNYLPIDEQHPRRPVSDYGRMMLALENSLEDEGLRTGSTTITMRLSNVYGRPGYLHADQGVVEHFARCLRAGHPMRVRGSVENIRDYIHIDDCVRALSFAAERVTESTILNVGTGIGTSVRKLGNLLARIYGVPSEFLQERNDANRISANVLNVEKACRVLEWRPLISLAEGIESLAKELEERGSRIVKSSPGKPFSAHVLLER